MEPSPKRARLAATAEAPLDSSRTAVESIDWTALQTAGSRAEAFEALAALVRSGKLRLRGNGAASVSLEVSYRFLYDQSTSEEDRSAEVHGNFMGQAAYDALRACTAATGGLKAASLFYTHISFSRFCPIGRSSEDTRCSGCNLVSSHIFDALFALRPPISTASPIRSISINFDAQNLYEETSFADHFSPEVLRRSLSPFSGLQSLALPALLYVDEGIAAAIVRACPSLRSLLISDKGSTDCLGPLAQLEELRTWDVDSSWGSGSEIVAFLRTPAGRNLRVIGDRAAPVNAVDGLERDRDLHPDLLESPWPWPAHFTSDAFSGLTHLKHLERLDFTNGVDLSVCS
eukprot:tig00021579_g22437.t1